MLREPLLHFLLVGALLFAADAVLNDATPPAEPVIRISQEEVAGLQARWLRQYQRPPAEELRGLLQWLIEEARSIGLLTLYFAACFIVVMLLKQLWLEEYGIAFNGISVALLAALVTAKVMIVLDHLPLARWLRGWPGAVEVAIRSTVYTTVVLLVLMIEKAFESRAEQGGLMPALVNIFEHSDLPNVLATTIVVGLSFLAYTTFTVVHREIGAQRVREIFLLREENQA